MVTFCKYQYLSLSVTIPSKSLQFYFHKRYKPRTSKHKQNSHSIWIISIISIVFQFVMRKLHVGHGYLYILHYIVHHSCVSCSLHVWLYVIAWKENYNRLQNDYSFIISFLKKRKYDWIQSGTYIQAAISLFKILEGENSKFRLKLAPKRLI